MSVIDALLEFIAPSAEQQFAENRSRMNEFIYYNVIFPMYDTSDVLADCTVYVPYAWSPVAIVHDVIMFLTDVHKGVAGPIFVVCETEEMVGQFSDSGEVPSFVHVSTNAPEEGIIVVVGNPNEDVLDKVVKSDFVFIVMIAHTLPAINGISCITCVEEQPAEETSEESLNEPSSV